MFALVEAQLERVITHGLTKVRSDPSLLNDLFYFASDEVKQEMITYFGNTTNKIPVRVNWPKSGFDSPSVNILNAGDTEDSSNDALDDNMGSFAAIGADEEDIEYHGIAKNGTWQIMCMSPDPRLSMFIAYIVEALLLLNRVELMKGGLHNMTLSSADLRFEEGLSPEFTNSRLVTLTALHYAAVPVKSRLLTELCVSVTM